jgi:hypothetical protein
MGKNKKKKESNIEDPQNIRPQSSNNAHEHSASCSHSHHNNIQEEEK